MHILMVANGYSDNIFVKLFISEIVHTEDLFVKYTINSTLQAEPTLFPSSPQMLHLISDSRMGDDQFLSIPSMFSL